MAYVAGEGCTISDGTSEIAQVISIDGPSMAVAEVEVTHLGSTAKEFRASQIYESGEVTFEIEYDPSNSTHSTLQGYAQSAQSSQSFVLTFSDDSTYTFQAFVTAFEVSGMEVEGNLTASVTLRITGGITVS